MQPESLTVTETVIQLNYNQDWLYAAIDLGSNKSLHTTLETRITKLIANALVRELREKHDLFDIVFLTGDNHSPNYTCELTILISDTNETEP